MLTSWPRCVVLNIGKYVGMPLLGLGIPMLSISIPILGVGIPILGVTETSWARYLRLLNIENYLGIVMNRKNIGT